MRILNVLRNSIYSLSSFLFIGLLGIIVRKYFTMYLQLELLGLEGLFSNIVQMLSLAELGLSSIISYGLYRELASNNRAEVNILMNIYRYIYMIIGGVILAVGVILFFFLPFIVKDVNVPWSYIELVYIVQIATILTSYFLAYKRTLFTADQKDYVCIKIDTVCSFFNNALRLLAIIVFQNYFFYVVIGLFFNILANIIISVKVQQQYPFLKSMKVTFQDMRERKFFIDIKNLLIHKISGLIYGGADSIIISSMLGLYMTGLYANYYIIHMGIFNVMYKVLQGIVPSIGNLVYEENLSKTLRIYKMLDMAYMLFAGYMFCIYVVAFQPFIQLFFGEQFLLPYVLVVVLAVFVFAMIQFENACNFRNAFGNFDNDRAYMVMAAVGKLSVAIPFIYYQGIIGLIIGSLVGWLFIGYGRIQFVFRQLLHLSIRPYLWDHFVWSLIVFFEVYVIYAFFYYINFEITYLNILIKCIVSFIIMAFCQIIVFHKTQEFKDICYYVRKTKKFFCEKSDV